MHEEKVNDVKLKAMAGRNLSRSRIQFGRTPYTALSLLLLSFSGVVKHPRVDTLVRRHRHFPQMAIPKRQESIDTLKAWLLEHGGKADGVKVEWLDETTEVGFVAARDLPSNTTVFEVPFALVINRASGLNHPVIGSTMKKIDHELDDELFGSATGVIALQLLYAARCVQRGEPNNLTAYLRSLPQKVNLPFLWSRNDQKKLLNGTSFLDDTRILRSGIVREFRNVRRLLRQNGHRPLLEKFGLDASAGPCPLSGRSIAPLQRYLVAQAFVRSRALMLTYPDQSEDLCLVPGIDMANHNANPDMSFGWSDDETMNLCTNHAVKAGSQVCVSYDIGLSSRRSSIESHGFSTDLQLPTFSLYMAPDMGDPYADKKKKVLLNAGLLSRSGDAIFQLPLDPPEELGELLPALRLLVLPPEESSKLLDSVHKDDWAFVETLPLYDIVNKEGVNVWNFLSDPAPKSMDHVVYNILLESSAHQLQTLVDSRPAADDATAGGLVDMANTIRDAEMKALDKFLPVVTHLAEQSQARQTKKAIKNKAKTKAKRGFR